MPARFLLDSTILIDHLNGIPQATEWLSGLKPDEALISAITRAEVLVKAGEQWEGVSAFLDEYDCLTVGPDEADMAAGIRNRYRLRLPDAFQAALAQSEELILVTRDAKDFQKIKELEVKIPYRIL
ncbi:MAG: PIN domain-containing protein [Candidatus Omnitrophica bacterium]|nr:PIN domain-containing protein [Candidatus Omnitrophota bacterium]